MVYPISMGAGTNGGCPSDLSPWQAVYYTISVNGSLKGDGSNFWVYFLQLEKYDIRVWTYLYINDIQNISFIYNLQYMND